MEEWESISERLAQSLDLVTVNLRRSKLLPRDEARLLVNSAGSLMRLQGTLPLIKEWHQRGLVNTWQLIQMATGRSKFRYGHYILEEHLADGGMGSVFRARDSRNGFVAAVKTLNPGVVTSTVAVKRFRREIEALRQLEHLNIVEFINCSLDTEMPYLAMEFVDGQTLEALSGRLRTMPIDLLCEIGRQTAIGVQYANSHGVIHRDLKPSNLMVTTAGQNGAMIVKILDFGLTRLSESAVEVRDLTATGLCIGTPEFIAPEQAMNSKEADVRSDVFSLGCVLYWSATGKLPWHGASVVETIMLRMRHDAPPVRTLRPDTPDDLADLITRMMRREPAQRATIDEAIAVLGRHAGDSKQSLNAPETTVDSDASSSSVTEFAGRLISSDDFARLVGD